MHISLLHSLLAQTMAKRAHWMSDASGNSPCGMRSGTDLVLPVGTVPVIWDLGALTLCCQWKQSLWYEIWEHWPCVASGNSPCGTRSGNSLIAPSTQTPSLSSAPTVQPASSSLDPSTHTYHIYRGRIRGYTTTFVKQEALQTHLTWIMAYFIMRVAFVLIRQMCP